MALCSGTHSLKEAPYPRVPGEQLFNPPKLLDDISFLVAVNAAFVILWKCTKNQEAASDANKKEKWNLKDSEKEESGGVQATVPF